MLYPCSFVYHVKMLEITTWIIKNICLPRGKVESSGLPYRISLIFKLYTFTYVKDWISALASMKNQKIHLSRIGGNTFYHFYLFSLIFNHKKFNVVTLNFWLFYVVDKHSFNSYGDLDLSTFYVIDKREVGFVNFMLFLPIVMTFFFKNQTS